MGVAQMLTRFWGLPVRGVGKLRAAARANRVSPVLSNRWESELGVGQSWMPLSYGEYYPRSALVYSAIRVRQDAIARVPLQGLPAGGRWRSRSGSFQAGGDKEWWVRSGRPGAAARLRRYRKFEIAGPR
jgi:hypothetical protein